MRELLSASSTYITRMKILLAFVSVVLYLSFGHCSGTSTSQCSLKDRKLKCGTATCPVTMGNPSLPAGKYRIGKKQTETAEGLPSPPFYYVYKAINNDPTKGFWAEMTFIPEMRCTKETPWMNSDSLVVANSFGLQDQQCYNRGMKNVLDGITPKRFDVKVCPSANACQTGQCANLATLGAMSREYIADLVVES